MIETLQYCRVVASPHVIALSQLRHLRLSQHYRRYSGSGRLMTPLVGHTLTDDGPGLVQIGDNLGGKHEVEMKIQQPEDPHAAGKWFFNCWRRIIMLNVTQDVRCVQWRAYATK